MVPCDATRKNGLDLRRILSKECWENKSQTCKVLCRRMFQVLKQDWIKYLWTAEKNLVLEEGEINVSWRFSACNFYESALAVNIRWSFWLVFPVSFSVLFPVWTQALTELEHSVICSRIDLLWLKHTWSGAFLNVMEAWERYTGTELVVS